MRKSNLAFVVLLIASAGVDSSLAQSSKLFSIDSSADKLVAIDPDTGHVEVVGPLGFDVDNVDLTNHNGVLYGLDSRIFDRVELFEISWITGTASRLVRVTQGGQDVLAAEGLASLGGELIIGFNLDRSNDYTSDALGTLNLDGSISNVVAYPDATTDFDGLTADSTGVAELLSTDVDGPSRPGGPVGSTLFRVNRSPQQYASVAQTNRLADTAFLDSELYGIGVDTKTLHELDAATGLTLNTISLDRPGLYRGLAAIPELPQQRPSDPVTPPPTSPEKKNLVFITHGCCTSDEVWQDKEGKWQPLIADIEEAIAHRPDADEWAVWRGNWTDKNDLPVSVPNAITRGVQVGLNILQKDPDWDYVHLIGHSAGSVLVATAATFIELSGADIETHVTLLDAPFMFDPLFRQLYGRKIDWVDSYFAHDRQTWIVGTEGRLPYAHNVDVTWLDPDKIVDPSNLARSSHGWPIDFYRESIAGIAGAEKYGFARSLEGGGWADRGEYPPGNDPPKGFGDSTGTQGAFAEREDPPINIAAAPHVVSDIGTVNISGTSFSLQTGSPVWLAVATSVTEPVNFITLEADFTSDPGAEGLLAVYWRGEVLGLIDERFVLDGMQEYMFFLPGTFTPGTYDLGFRLDPYADVDSIVVIDNVSTGQIVPEPSTLILLGMGAVSLLAYALRKRR